MRFGYNSIKVTSAHWKDPRPITIVIAHITGIGQETTDPEGNAWVSTLGGQTYRVRESYEQVLEKVKRA